MKRLVKKEDVARFHEDGAVRLKGIISSDWLDLLDKGFSQAIASPGKFSKSYGPAGAPRYYTDHRLFNRFEPLEGFYLRDHSLKPRLKYSDRTGWTCMMNTS